MSKFSVKRPFLVLVVVLALTVLGGVGFTRMTTDFLPEMEFPYLIVITTYPGASPQRVESEVTTPLEGSLSTVNGVTDVTSTSAENYSQIFLEFEENTNMDSAMVKVTSSINQVSLPDSCGEPIIMELSADMIPTLYTGVSYKDMSGDELSDFINDEIIPALMRQDGVASIQTSGLITDSVELRLSQDKIDEVNGRILAQTNDKLGEAAAQIADAKSSLSSAEAQLRDQQSALSDTQKDTADQLAEFTRLMNEAVATKAAYESQYNSLLAYQTALQTELSAYEDNGVTAAYAQINDGFSHAQDQLQEQLDAIDAQIASALASLQSDPSNAATYQATLTTLYTQRQALETQKSALPSDIKDAIDHPAKLSAFVGFASSMGADTSQLTAANLQSLYDITNTRIPQINTELANIATELIAAKAALDAVNAQITQATDNYAAVEAQKMTAAAAFGAANAQLSSGQQTIDSSRAELDEAEASYENSRDEALKAANIDSLLSMDTLSALLAAQSFSMPAGYINDDKTQYLLKFDEATKSLDEILDLPLVNIDGIGIIRVSDVADVTMIDDADTMYAKLNGDDAVVLAIYKSSSAGTSAVSDAIADEIAALEEEYEGLSFTTLSDQGDYIRIVISSVLSNLIWGALLAILVLFLFLRDIRPTVVVAFAIPLSVLFAILTMYFTDITLNIISLSGLALGIGMLVDNSIVVIENIYRLRAKGIPAARAAVMGANQVAGAIFSSTLTTVCVFLPIVFTNGLSRQILQDMCLTITYSLLASLIVALTVVPTLGSTLLKHDTAKEHRLFDRVTDLYETVLRFCLRVKVAPLLLSIALLAFCTVRVFSTGIVLIPEMSSYQMSVTLEASPETESSEDYAMLDDISDAIRSIEGVETVGSIQSATLGFGNIDTKAYEIMIILDHDYASQNAKIAKKIDALLADYEGIDDYSVSESNMDTSSVLGGGLEVNITGNDEEKLLAISADVMDLVSSIKGFSDVTNGQEAADTELLLAIDKDKAIEKGLTVAQIYQAIYGKLNTSSTATEVTIDEETYDVIIVDERNELTKDNLLAFTIDATTTNAEGESETNAVPLSDFATIEEKDSVSSIAHDNGTKQITVSAATDEGYNTTLLSRELEDKLESYDTPDGYHIEVAGETELTSEMVKNMLLMMTVAVILIYLIMVAQFANFLSPFIVMFTIPLAFTGGFLALMLTGQELSLLSMMGFLILAGVVVNNGIVFIDYANQLRRDGMEKHEALVETGRTRMRPILMTAMTTILAMSVMAFSRGEAAELGRGMAIVTIGGLTYATLMTLFIVPVLYDLFYRREVHHVDLGNESELYDMDV